MSTESKQILTSTVAQQTVPIGLERGPVLVSIRHVWCVGIEMFEGGLQSEKDVEAQEGCQPVSPTIPVCFSLIDPASSHLFVTVVFRVVALHQSASFQTLRHILDHSVQRILRWLKTRLKRAHHLSCHVNIKGGGVVGVREVRWFFKVFWEEGLGCF